MSEILSGIRLIKASEIAPIVEYLELNSVPIVGRVGAGALDRAGTGAGTAGRSWRS